MADANENKGPENQEALTAKIAELENQNKNLVREAMEKKEAIRKLEEERKAEEDKSLKEQNKYKELYEGSLPKLERLNKLEPTLNSMLETEVSEIPEDKRDVIPQFSLVEDKILWIRQAKSKGLFKASSSEPEKKQPANSVQSKTNTNETSQEFLSWAATDPRLKSLSLADYRLWKEQNRPGKKVSGWGG